MAEKYFLSEDDVAVLKRIIAEFDQFKRMSGRSRGEEKDDQAPEVYVVRVPSDGIAAVVTETRYGTATGSGTPSEPLYTEVSSAECDIYKVAQHGTIEELESIEVPLSVYNLSEADVAGDSWALAVRDKDGTYFAVPTAVSSSSSSTNTVTVECTGLSPVHPGNTYPGKLTTLEPRGITGTGTGTGFDTDAWSSGSSVRLKMPNDYAPEFGKRYTAYYAGLDDSSQPVYICDATTIKAKWITNTTQLNVPYMTALLVGYFPHSTSIPDAGMSLLDIGNGQVLVTQGPASCLAYRTGSNGFISGVELDQQIPGKVFVGRLMVYGSNAEMGSYVAFGRSPLYYPDGYEVGIVGYGSEAGQTFNPGFGFGFSGGYYHDVPGTYQLWKMQAAGVYTSGNPTSSTPTAAAFIVGEGSVHYFGQPGVVRNAAFYVPYTGSPASAAVIDGSFGVTGSFTSVVTKGGIVISGTAGTSAFSGIL